MTSMNQELLKQYKAEIDQAVSYQQEKEGLKNQTGKNLYQKAFEQGFLLGWQKGDVQRQHKIVANMHAQGLSAYNIKTATELSLQEIEFLTQTTKENDHV